MKVHVMQIPQDGRHEEGELPGSVLELQDERIRVAGPLRYDFDMGVEGDDLWVRGHLAIDVECECVRCLEKFHQEITVPEFVHVIELQGREMVDLTEQLREDTLLALPAHPHCDWDGKKACEAEFSNTAADAASPDDGEAPRDAWGALDNLKL